MSAANMLKDLSAALALSSDAANRASAVLRYIIDARPFLLRGRSVQLLVVCAIHCGKCECLED